VAFLGHPVGIVVLTDGQLRWWCWAKKTWFTSEARYDNGVIITPCKH